jgi:polyisoprenoid-binding protein YceI
VTLREGAYRLGPQSGRLRVLTGRTGLGARAGHDLVIEVTSWNCQVTVNHADPAQSSVTVEVDVDSFEVREGTGGVKPLTDSDRSEIRRTIRAKILRTSQHPTITFRSMSVSGSPEALTIDGELTIMGITSPTTVQAAVSHAGDVRGSATVAQSSWGIKPYSAFLGALRLADEVAIELDGTLTTAGSES